MFVFLVVVFFGIFVWGCVVVCLLGVFLFIKGVVIFFVVGVFLVLEVLEFGFLDLFLVGVCRGDFFRLVFVLFFWFWCMV